MADLTPPPLTPDQLMNLDINREVALQARQDAERLLEDLLSAKATFETKASALFSVYITVALAVLSASAVASADQLPGLRIGLWAAGSALAVGAACFVIAFRRQNYGTLGTHPDLWLRPGVIDGGQTALAANSSYIAFFYRYRIEISSRSNDAKAAWIEVGIWAGLLSPILMLSALLGAYLAR